MRRRTPNQHSVEHLRVLGARRARLWREVRAARSRHHGYRDAAVAEVAAANDLDVAELAQMKRELIDAGVVAKHRFYVTDGDIRAAGAVDGSANHQALAERAVGEFESLRFAYNAAAAIRALRPLDDTGRAQLRDLPEAALGERGDRHTTVTSDGIALLAGAHRNHCTFRVGDARPWTGTVNQARWIAEVLTTGHVDTVNGAVRIADPLPLDA